MITIQGDSGGRIPRFVDLDFGSSPGWWAAAVATYCPSRMVEHPKSKSTKPSLRGHGTPCTCALTHQLSKQLSEGPLAVGRLDLAQLRRRLHRLLEPAGALGARQRRPPGRPHLGRKNCGLPRVTRYLKVKNHLDKYLDILTNSCLKTSTPSGRIPIFSGSLLS